MILECDPSGCVSQEINLTVGCGMTAGILYVNET